MHEFWRVVSSISVKADLLNVDSYLTLLLTYPIKFLLRDFHSGDLLSIVFLPWVSHCRLV